MASTFVGRGGSGLQQDSTKVVEVTRGSAASSVVLVCEHASRHIPEALDHLGISPAARESHIAWDPGALGVVQGMADAMDAVLVASRVSRLVYDCNRPPSAADAMPDRSEAYDVPGNVGLSDSERQDRVAAYYTPFREAVAAEVAKRDDPVVVTVHSFTPVYLGQSRAVEIGILHDSDSRLADAMLAVSDGYDVRRNAPYGPADGVTHTLKEHAVKHGHLNVMIEVRSDLIADDDAQVAMAKTLTSWVSKALEATACKA